jgi:hypothetical protein
VLNVLNDQIPTVGKYNEAACRMQGSDANKQCRLYVAVFKHHMLQQPSSGDIGDTPLKA